jgi:hypothetical protein
MRQAEAFADADATGRPRRRVGLFTHETRSTSLKKKSSASEIEARFDRDVDRFSNLETGQSATIDAPLAMELITEAAIAVCIPAFSLEAVHRDEPTGGP